MQQEDRRRIAGALVDLVHPQIAERIPVIDTDSHITEPADLWVAEERTMARALGTSRRAVRGG